MRSELTARHAIRIEVLPPGSQIPPRVHRPPRKDVVTPMRYNQETHGEAVCFRLVLWGSTKGRGHVRERGGARAHACSLMSYKRPPESTVLPHCHIACQRIVALATSWTEDCGVVLPQLAMHGCQQRYGRSSHTRCCKVVGFGLVLCEVE